MEQITITIFYGKGEYAVTDKVIPKLIEALKDYDETNTWKWALQDFLGIKMDGKFSNRYHAVIKALENVEDEKVVELYTALSNVEEKDAEDIQRVKRMTSEEKAARRLEIETLLEDVDIDPKEKEKMLKAI